jgi:hypothetical protein
MELINKTFRECTLTFLDKAFKMRQLSKIAPMTEWLNTPNEISDFERQILLYYQKNLDFNVHNWNEN